MPQRSTKKKTKKTNRVTKRKVKKSTKRKVTKRKVKKSTKRKVTKRKVKKSTKRKVTKTAKRKPKKVRKQKDEDILAMDQEIAIWGSYGRLQSIALVAEDLGVTVHRVRTTLAYDKGRLDRIKQDHIERAAARWELKRDESLDMIDRSMKLYLGMFTAIDEAIKKGTITVIRGKDGLPMAVCTAQELMVQSRMMDQFIKLAAQSESTAASLRSGHVPTVGGDGAVAGEAVIPEPSAFNDLQLYEMITALGDDAPESLRLKAEQFKKKQLKKLQQLDKT